MIRIEKISTKFNQLKNKLDNSHIDNLTKTGEQSILLLLNNKPKNFSFPSQKKEKKTINKQTNENNPNSKSKEKKFLTQKVTEQNIQTNQNNNNISKDKSPINIPKTTNTSNNPTNINSNNTQGQIKPFQQNNNYKNNNTNNPATINLLLLEYGEVKTQDVQKIFEVERNEEEKKLNMEDKNKKIEQNEEKNKNISDGDIEEDSFFFDDEIDNVEKKKKSTKKEANNNNNIINSSLFLNKKESLINFNQKFNIFDETKMMRDEDDILNNNNDYYDYYTNPYNKKTDNFSPKYNEPNNNINNENTIKSKNKINNIKKKEKEKEKSKTKDKNINSINEIKNNENNKLEKEENNNNTNNNNLLIDNNRKFSILMTDDMNELNDNFGEGKNKNKENNSLLTPTKKNINENKDKIIKKKESHKNPIRKNLKNLKSKSCLNPAGNLNFSNKKNSKVIMDDEEEENIDVNNNKNIETTPNDLFLSSSKINKEKITDGKNSILKTDGNKFTLLINNNESRAKKPDNKQNQNIDKNNSNINKNNINENYDLICINGIGTILSQIKEKLKNENNDKKIDNRCFEIIERINNNKTDLKKRKENTYLGILKILELLFSLLCENKKCKMYNNEILNILDIIQKYYKNVKKYDIIINNDQYYFNKKTAFKYIYSSLELKNYDYYSLKDKTKKNSIEENNELIKLAKLYRRYKKSSEYLNKKYKDFKEKLNNPLNKTKYNISFLKKYETFNLTIQTSPNFMTYMKLFNHYVLVSNFFNDIKTFNGELKEVKKKYKTIDSKREKSMQINRNGFNDKINNRERSRNKEIEKEREKEKEKEKERSKGK